MKSMTLLDNIEDIKKYDPENMRGSLLDWPDQIHAAWKEAEKLVLPTHYVQAKNIIILGVESAAVAGEMIHSLAQAEAAIPVVINRQDYLPKWVDSKTLVIGVSYSGNTLETTAAFLQAGQLGAKLLGISSGGEISALCRKFRAPHFQINYGAQSRAALAYMLMSLVVVFSKLQFIDKNYPQTFPQIISHSQQLIESLKPDNHTMNNPAKKLARELIDRLPIVLSSPLISPAARRWKNQLNESAKSLSFFEDLPELTHSTIAGFDFPPTIMEKVVFINLRSAEDSDFNARRQNILRDQLGQSKSFQEIVAHPALNLLSDLLYLTIFGDFTAFYLSILNNTDPSDNQRIELFHQAVLKS